MHWDEAIKSQGCFGLTPGGHGSLTFLSRQTTVRTLSIIKPIRDLRSRLTAAYEGTTDAELVDFNAFVDLLEGCLTLNPEKRIKAADALKHPLFTNKRR